MAENSTLRKKGLKNHESRRPPLTPTDQPSSKKYQKKGVNPVRVSGVELSPDYGVPDSSICANSSCRATMSMDDKFCKRCSCCICKLFDDNKDPSLWFVCTSENDNDVSCGLSSHLECALQKGKVGVIGLGQSMNLDGSYCCASCNKLSPILGCWKKQLMIAKDARRVDVLCERISLSHRLLKGTLKFQELHGIVEDVMTKLEREVGPVNVVSGKMSRGGIVSRLSIAGEVQQLCALAIEKADEWLAALSITNLHQRDNSGTKIAILSSDRSLSSGCESPSVRRRPPSLLFDLNIASVPDLNEDISPFLNTAIGEDYRRPICLGVRSDNEAAPLDNKKMALRSDGSGVSTNGDMPAVNSREGLCRGRAVTTTEVTNECAGMLNGSPLGISKELGNLDFNFDYCVRVICKLEGDGHIKEEFRKKFLTWFSLRSTEHEKRVVKTFIQCIDDHSSLAAQLVDTFSDIVNFKKPHNGI